MVMITKSGEVEENKESRVGATLRRGRRQKSPSLRLGSSAIACNTRESMDAKMGQTVTASMPNGSWCLGMVSQAFTIKCFPLGPKMPPNGISATLYASDAQLAKPMHQRSEKKQGQTLRVKTGNRLLFKVGST